MILSRYGIGKLTASKNISRRRFIKYGVGVAGAAAVGALGYYWYVSRPPEERQQIRYLGYPFYLPDDAVAQWEETTDIPLEVTYEDFFVLGQRQLADIGAWDVGASGRHRQLVTEDALQPIPVDQLPRWKSEKILDIFYNPQSYFSAAQAERFNNLLWDDKPTQLRSVPIMWNFDSLTYLPEFMPFEERPGEVSMSYEEMWNPEWKGKVMGSDEGFTNFAETSNVLEATGQMDVSGAISSLTTDEVDQVFNFLLPIMQSGQYRTFWFAYGDAVNLLSTREVYMGSTWQPVSFDVRKTGTPAYYAALEHGPFFWFNANYVSSEAPSEVMDEVTEFLNFHLSLDNMMLYTRQGYPAANILWEDYKEAMGDEFYDWFYNGTRTYLPIDEAMEVCWPDDESKWTLEERLQHALFLHDIYYKHFWVDEPPRTGNPHSKGNFRDIGSVDFKQQITRYFVSPDLPDNNDYYVEKYEELKASLPG